MFLRFICNTLCYMKHTVSRKKPLVKSPPPAGKAVLKNSLKPVAAVEKKSKVISSKKLETKPEKKTAAQKPVQLVKPTVKKTVAKTIAPPKLKVKIEKVRTVKAARKNSQPISFQQNTKTKATKSEAIISAKSEKSKNQKPTSTAGNKTGIADKKIPTAAKSSVKAAPKKNQPTNAAKKTAIETAKPKSVALTTKAKPTDSKLKAIAAPQKSNAKVTDEIGKLELFKTIKKVKAVENKTHPGKLPTIQTLKKAKPQPIVSAKANNVSAKTKKQVVAPVVSIRKPEIVQIKVVENKIEEIKIPILVKPRNKKAKPIGSAVFRGKKDRYDFKVFALNETFEAIPAVYIISKRITDKRKKSHHALICIGVTDSIFDELKKHRKGKCIKKHAANVISILPEADEKMRLKIETDLKAAHAIACNFN